MLDAERIIRHGFYVDADGRKQQKSLKERNELRAQAKFTKLLENVDLGVLEIDSKSYWCGGWGIDAVQFAGVDETHEQIAHLGAILGLIKQRVLANMETFP